MTPQKTAYNYAQTPLHNLTGKTFGRWKVVKQAESKPDRQTRWLCRCICGTNRVVLAGSLKKGLSQSCGCLATEMKKLAAKDSHFWLNPYKKKLITLTGKTFGRWKVVKQAESKPDRKTRWLCRCICGINKVVLGYHLKKGGSQSCGCLATEMKKLTAKDRLGSHKKELGIGAMKKVIRSYRGRAKECGRNWALTENQAISLFQGKCHYCGGPPNQCSRRKYGNGDYVYNGIDRVDNSVGYEPGNVVSCCKRCNFAKADMTYGEFHRWIEQVYFHHMDGAPPPALSMPPPAPAPAIASSGAASCGGVSSPAAG